MTRLQAGVIGLGNMGGGVAKNLAAAGYETGVWDVSEEAIKKFRDIENTYVLSPGEMASEGATLFYVVPATQEIEETLNGEQGVLAKAIEGTVVFDLTTSFPEDTRRVVEIAAKHKVKYLDAAMSGGATGADSGTLTLMIGGDKNVYERSRPMLNAIAKSVYYLGESGAGHAMKLIHNMVVHTIFLTNCEAGIMAEAAGISLADMVEVFNNSNARSYSSEFRFPKHILSEKWDARSRVYNLNKDLGMAVRMAESMNIDARYAKETLKFLNRAIDNGMAEKDYSLLYPEFDKIRNSN
ncbi:MAG: NAD(P)-dependent oxidoreductase [Alphaproteobacteria bacterium]|nr:NAD(P)-dependent oxidoreductase [Alphaproteobacteria bacterium]